MKKYSALSWIVVVAISCKFQPESNREYDKFDENKVYRLQLNPTPGSIYKYEIHNESEIDVEIEGKEIHTVNKSDVELKYSVEKDSAGNYIFTATYDKIRLHTKSGDTETEADSDNANVSIDPVEKMLGILKAARIVTTVSPNGEVKDVKGYNELGSKLMEGFSEHDQYGRTMAKAQWEKVVGEGVVKNTMEQIFKIFPDSAIHIRDTWKLNTRQGGELPMNVKSINTLKAINNDIAVISSEGVVTSDGGASNSVMGYQNVSADLKGEQEGELEIETKTGMLINNETTATVKGSLQVMGKEIPVNIKNSMKMSGRKVK